MKTMTRFVVGLGAAMALAAVSSPANAYYTIYYWENGNIVGAEYFCDGGEGPFYSWGTLYTADARYDYSTFGQPPC